MEQDIDEIMSLDEGDNPYDQATWVGRQVEVAPLLTRAVSENQSLFFSFGGQRTNKLLD